MYEGSETGIHIYFYLQRNRKQLFVEYGWPFKGPLVFFLLCVFSLKLSLNSTHRTGIIALVHSHHTATTDLHCLTSFTTDLKTVIFPIAYDTFSIPFLFSLVSPA